MVAIEGSAILRLTLALNLAISGDNVSTLAISLLRNIKQRKWVECVVANEAKALMSFNGIQS